MPWQSWHLAKELLERPIGPAGQVRDGYYREAYGFSRKKLTNHQERMPCHGELIPHCEPIFQEEADSKKMGYEFLVHAPQVADAIQMTLQIQNGIFRAYTGEEAKRVFLEYDRKYGFENTDRYSPCWNSYSGEPIISEQLLRECMEQLGLDDDRYIRFLVEQEKMELSLMQEE